MTEPLIGPVPPGHPWQHVLGRLPTRVARGLARCKLHSISEAVSVVRRRPPPARHVFSAASLSTLRVILIRRGLMDRAELSAPVPVQWRTAEGDTRAESARERLRERGVDLDRPWREALHPRLPSRAVHALDALGLRTVRDVLHALEWGRLLEVRSFGVGSLRAVREALLQLADPDDAAPPGRPPPATLEELFALVQRTPPMTPERWTMITRRTLHGAPLAELSPGTGLRPEAVRQQIFRWLQPLPALHGPAARAVLGELLSALRDSGGLLHRAEVEALGLGSDLPAVVLALRIAGEARAGLLGEDLVHLGPAAALRGRLALLRGALGGRPRRSIPLDELARLASAEAQLSLSRQALEALLQGPLAGRRPSRASGTPQGAAPMA